ncbi:MAG TPA: DNA methyltransferase [Plasticicumulans sp.]|uniref:site-specific DNA-methyltransferase n=1 Tax=Pseudomonadota TaxID=1224 RepID=UPI002CBCF5F1|nr:MULTISPECIES: DNA methyltransferase [Pseudomonadota]HMW28828.1 DNA methyltransferase [Plasticicumulans sp.]HNG88128.1 DNA methyltransferase [Accumulibacter sp.]
MSTPIPPLQQALLALVPADGSSIGNTALRKALGVPEADYWAAQAALVADGTLLKGAGRGGSVRRAQIEAQPAVVPVTEPVPAAVAVSPALSGDEAAGEEQMPAVAEASGGFALESQVAPPPSPVQLPLRTTAPKPSAPVAARPAKDESVQVLSYRHLDRRVNNPEVGMVTPATDPETGKQVWAYSQHLDPALQFDPQRAQIEALIDEALASGEAEVMRMALEELKRLQSPYLQWAGKAERTQFEVDTVSLHVHERIDPASILAAVRKGMKDEGKPKAPGQRLQYGLFDAPFENLPLRDAIDFYRHERGWANRLVAGDSLLVMNSLLQKENMAGRVQMIYIDPPYGIKYGSNFQPFVGKRDVKDRNDADLTQEPEMIKAFRDTWELGIHSYLTYLRDRLLLAHKLLHESGSVFVQISDENLHHVREIMDDVFEAENFVSVIVVQKTGGQSAELLANIADYCIWYAKSKISIKYRQIYREKTAGEGHGSGERYNLTDKSGRHFQWTALVSNRPPGSFPIEFQGITWKPSGGYWKTGELGFPRLIKAGRVTGGAKTLRYKRFLDDFPAYQISNVWTDVAGSPDKMYVVQTAAAVIQRCLLMTTDPGDLVLDPTCGSGTTAYVAEKWGRRWITCDTSRVAVTLAKQRLMTASYDYYELKYPQEGLKGGFIYKTVPHVTLKSIANNPDIDSIHDRLHPAITRALALLNGTLKTHPPRERFKVSEGGRKGQWLDFAKGDGFEEWEVPFDYPDDWPEAARAPFDAFHSARQAMQRQMDDSIAAHAEQEVLYDQPAISKTRLRITGPFTVEAVPFPSVRSLDDTGSGPAEADASIARTGESGRQHQWRDELQKTGIRGKGGQMLKFTDLEALPSDQDIRNLHASGHLDSGERVVVSFGPEHAALEQRQVENALAEAGRLFPLPKMIVFCAFAFDPEAAKDIDALRGITALKAQMNTDLLTEDLKKARASNQSFWLMGQPDVEVRQRPDGLYEVEVHGFDYFDTIKGELISGGKNKIALWALDPDYDERSLFPRQVFFPLAGKGEGWEKLRKTIRAELDESRLSHFHGTISLPFAAGDHRRIAVKIVDDRGIESLKVMMLGAN